MHVVETIIQSPGSYSDLMDKLGDKGDSERNDAYHEELRKRILSGLAPQKSG